MSYLTFLELAVTNPDVTSDWDDLRAAMQAIISEPLSENAKRVLRLVVAFEGELRLNEGAAFPHSKSPEDLLKSLAAQALAKSGEATLLR